MTQTTTQSFSVIGDFPVCDWKISILFSEGKYSIFILPAFSHLFEVNRLTDFFPNVDNQYQIKYKVEDKYDSSRNTLSSGSHISISCLLFSYKYTSGYTCKKVIQAMCNAACPYITRLPVKYKEAEPV